MTVLEQFEFRSFKQRIVVRSAGPVGVSAAEGVDLPCAKAPAAHLANTTS